MLTFKKSACRENGSCMYYSCNTLVKWFQYEKVLKIYMSLNWMCAWLHLTRNGWKLNPYGEGGWSDLVSGDIMEDNLLHIILTDAGILGKKPPSLLCCFWRGKHWVQINKCWISRKLLTRSFCLQIPVSGHDICYCHITPFCIRSPEIDDYRAGDFHMTEDFTWQQQ